MRDIRSLLENDDMEASAPCRIDMGGTLDLSTFYLPLRHLSPCTFNAAINLRTRVRLRPYAKGKLKISSKGFESLEADSASAPFSHPLGLMMAIATYYGADGVHIDIDSASPPRSALGGSSVAAVALVWAFAKTLARIGQPLPKPTEVALLAHAVEQSVAGVPCGLQDQLAAVYGGVNSWHWTAQPGGGLFERQEVVPVDAFRDFSEHLIVAYCGVPHASMDVNGTWVHDFVAGRFRSEWHQIVAYCRQFIQTLSRGDYHQAQLLMNSETDVRLRMTPDVVDEVGRQLMNVARHQGCGARFTGAGGGGCIWALGEPSKIRALHPLWQQILSTRSEAMILDTAVDPIGIL